MKQIGAWFGVFLMVLAGYFAFWPIPIAPNAWVAQPAPGYVGPHAQNAKLAGLKNIDIGKHTREVIEQVAGARVSMWLEGNHEPMARPATARGFEHGSEFAWMVAVVIDKQRTAFLECQTSAQ